MTTVPSPPGGGGDNENGNQKAGGRRSARKPRRSNPHFMTPAEAIEELDGLISRNAFYDATRRNEIPHVDFGRLKAVPRDFIPQLKERAMRKLDRSRNAQGELQPMPHKPRNKGDGDASQ
jgi:hypothetical protein